MPEEKPADLQEYTVTIGGLEHTVLLDEEGAAEYPDAKPAAKAKAPANKSRSTGDK